jgi:hypothetical protein
MAMQPLPYGIDDLDPKVVVDPNDRNRVRCYVRGCQNYVRRPTDLRNEPGEPCPTHGIYCRHSRTATYVYEDVRRNIIAAADLFGERVMGHPFKYDFNYLGNENSEDAVSWNVFRSIQESGHLAQLADLLIGEKYDEEPGLYLWGIRVSDDSFEPWDLLVAARDRFESNLPVDRPLTEPDIALHLPGKYLVLIEAKFTSPNGWYRQGVRQNDKSLTLEELLDIYSGEEVRLLNMDLAQQCERIPYQLWRNTVFADWMALQESPQTKPYHVNLVREGYEHESQKAFSALLNELYRDRFQPATWEAIYAWLVASSHCDRLRHYMEQKTANLVKALRT